MTFDERLKLQSELSTVFRPGAPINSTDLFCGRLKQTQAVIDAVFQPSQHVVLYGERGVGKTSLAKTLSQILRNAGVATVTSGTINCDGTDDFSSLWRKVFRELQVGIQTQQAGFATGTIESEFDFSQFLPDKITPDDVRFAFSRIPNPKNTIVVLDEVDRIKRRQITTLLADTLKNLSDHLLPVTMVLVGVADAVEQLISEHKSIDRALVQVPMPRMSESELGEIVQKGFSKVNMEIEDTAIMRITRLSQGLPHFTHLLSLNSAIAATRGDRINVLADDVFAATKDAVERSHTLLSDYLKAITSPQKQNLFEEVLIGCALAEKDELGWFSAASVVEPLSEIMQKPVSIPYFARHLNNFCTEKRGFILQQMGAARRYRYRFTNPLMQPFVIIHALSSGLIQEEILNRFS
jgi:Cdc6-like AAA superfamily ATPase